MQQANEESGMAACAVNGNVHLVDLERECSAYDPATIAFELEPAPAGDGAEKVGAGDTAATWLSDGIDGRYEVKTADGVLQFVVEIGQERDDWDALLRLVTAAPDLLTQRDGLLAALRRCARCLEALDGTETSADIGDVFDEARAVIARAEASL